ncbi:hypothetical protein [[Eubacterium] cellulosolvens]
MAGISRRYFVMNAFDGVMTILGMVIAAYFTGLHNPLWLISAGLGVSIAMGISGFSGAYLTEETEKRIELEHLEKYMLRNLDKSVIGSANRFASFWAALIDGLSPMLAALISLSPFILSMLDWIPMRTAMNISVVISFLFLFTLGAYLGKISKRNILFHGLKTLIAGLSVTVIIFLFSLKIS